MTRVMHGLKIAVFMSGGVDSSLAAALLSEQGHEILGITAIFVPENLATPLRKEHDRKNVRDAAKIAKRFGFEHLVVDVSRTFKKEVIDYFVEDYCKGKTPNPCARCNEYVKMGTLFQEAKRLGYPFFATGHYSKIEKDPETERFYLKSDFGNPKDQSYFLFLLGQETLKAFRLPLAGMTKKETLKLAEQKNLTSKHREESQEICFVPDNNYREFFLKNLDFKPQGGAIIDTEGKRIGTHRGIQDFTIGQRRGLGLGYHESLYVLKIDAKTNTLVVGSERELLASSFKVTGIKFMKATEIPEKMPLLVKIRSTSPPLACYALSCGDDIIQVHLEKPARAISPGQAAVFYDREGSLLSGGWIS